MGIVRAIQQGDEPASKFSKSAQDAAEDMKEKDVEDFASTKHKGLPKKVEDNEDVKKLEESILKIIQNHLPPHTTKGELLNSLNKRKR